MSLLLDIVGWLGVVALLGAYLAVSLQKVTPTNLWFQVANIFGAVTISINSLALKAYPSVAVNVVWTAIAIYAIIKNRKHRE